MSNEDDIYFKLGFVEELSSRNIPLQYHAPLLKQAYVSYQQKKKKNNWIAPTLGIGALGLGGLGLYSLLNKDKAPVSQPSPTTPPPVEATPQAQPQASNLTIHKDVINQMAKDKLNENFAFYPDEDLNYAGRLTNAVFTDPLYGKKDTHNIMRSMINGMPVTRATGNEMLDHGLSALAVPGDIPYNIAGAATAYGNSLLGSDMSDKAIQEDGSGLQNRIVLRQVLPTIGGTFLLQGGAMKALNRIEPKLLQALSTKFPDLAARTATPFLAKTIGAKSLGILAGTTFAPQNYQEGALMGRYYLRDFVEPMANMIGGKTLSDMVKRDTLVGSGISNAVGGANALVGFIPTVAGLATMVPMGSNMMNIANDQTKALEAQMKLDDAFRQGNDTARAELLTEWINSVDNFDNDAAFQVLSQATTPTVVDNKVQFTLPKELANISPRLIKRLDDPAMQKTIWNNYSTALRNQISVLPEQERQQYEAELAAMEKMIEN